MSEWWVNPQATAICTPKMIRNHDKTSISLVPTSDFFLYIVPHDIPIIAGSSDILTAGSAGTFPQHSLVPVIQNHDIRVAADPLFI